MIFRDLALPSSTERRARERFPVELPLKWRAGHRVRSKHPQHEQYRAGDHHRGRCAPRLEPNRGRCGLADAARRHRRVAALDIREGGQVQHGRVRRELSTE